MFKKQSLHDHEINKYIKREAWHNVVFLSFSFLSSLSVDVPLKIFHNIRTDNEREAERKNFLATCRSTNKFKSTPGETVSENTGWLRTKKNRLYQQQEKRGSNYGCYHFGETIYIRIIINDAWILTTKSLGGIKRDTSGVIPWERHGVVCLLADYLIRAWNSYWVGPLLANLYF